MSRRHRVKSIALSRTFNQRKALIKGLLVSLIEHGQINTTLTRAKVIKRYFDKLAAKAHKGDVHTRRQIAAFLSHPKAANKLVDVIAPSMKDRRSGFTTISKTTVRRGDASPMALLKLAVPLPEPVKKTTKKADKKTDKKKSTKKTAKKTTKKTTKK